MESVKTPWFKVGIFMLFFCNGLVVFLAITFYFIHDAVNWFLHLSMFSVWTLIALMLLVKGMLSKRRLNRLKKMGSCYEAKIKNLILSTARIFNYATAKAECIYVNKAGKSCMVVSGYHLFSPFDKKENLCAKIYVDDKNLRRYAVEVFRIIQ